MIIYFIANTELSVHIMLKQIVYIFKNRRWQ